MEGKINKEKQIGEVFNNLLKKVFLTFIVLSFIFLAFFILIKYKNVGLLFGSAGFLLFLIFAFIAEKENKRKIAQIFLIFGATIFIYSYFLIVPVDNRISFLTDNSHKLKKYDSYHLFHIPFYEKNFNYDIYQQRSFDYPEAEAKIIIGFEFNFYELFKHNRYVLVSEDHFDALIDSKVNLVKRYIEKIGIPRNLMEFQRFNDTWLKITSLKIEFKPIELQ